GATETDVGGSMAANLSAIWGAVADQEGATTKQVWVSEYGWRADVVGETAQADRMAAGFDAMKEDGHVALAAYFTYQDFPDNQWGVFDAAGTRRPSADRLGALAQANLPERGARVVGVVAPTLAPGAPGEVVVTLENRGTATWGEGWRLGAAPGCPDAASTNEVAWAPAAGAGYANSPTDARVFLPASGVTPGATVELHVPIVAPMQPGSYEIAARMV